MGNKRGFLLAEETLKIIIAVICIGLLVYLLFALYFSRSNERDLIDAQNSLKNSSNSFKSSVERVRLGNGNNGSYVDYLLIHNPVGWHLFSFVGSEKKPNSCAGQNCLCICDDVWVDTLVGLIDSRQIKECDDSGVCYIVSDLANKKIDIGIEKNTPFYVRKINDLITVEKDGI